MKRGKREFKVVVFCTRGDRQERGKGDEGGGQGFKPAASNPDTLPLPIIRALNTAGGRKKHDQ